MKIYRSLKQQNPHLTEEDIVNVQPNVVKPISKFKRSQEDYAPIKPEDIDPTTGRRKLDMIELGQAKIKNTDFWQKNATIPESTVDLNYIDDKTWNKIKKHDIDPLQLSQDQLDKFLADSQSGWEIWSKSNLNPINMATNVFGGIIKNVGLLGALATEWGDNRDYKNWITETGDWVSNLISDDIKLRPEYEGSLKGIGDPKWWIKNVVGIGDEAASFAISGAGIGGLARLGAGLATKGLARTAITASRINNALTRVSTAGALSYLEGASTGAQVFDTIYNHQLTNATIDQAKAAGFDTISDYAKHKAAIGAATTVQINTAINTLLNITSIAPLTRSNNIARNTSLGRLEKKGIGEGVESALTSKLSSKPISQLTRQEIIDLANPVKDQSKNALLRGLNKAKQEVLPSWNRIKNGDTGYLGETIQESLEESVNLIAEKTGEKAGKANEDYSFLDAFANMEMSSVFSDEGAFSAVLGGFGGFGNTAFIRNSKLAGWFGQPVYKTDEKGNYVYKRATEGQKADAEGYALGINGKRIKELEDDPSLFGKRFRILPKQLAGRQFLSASQKEDYENIRTLKRVLASIADDMADLQKNLTNLDKVVTQQVDLDGNKVDINTANRIADNIKADLFSSRAYASVSQGNGEYLATMLEKLSEVEGKAKISDLLTPQLEQAKIELQQLLDQKAADPDNKVIDKSIETYEANIEQMTDEISKYGHLTPLEKRGMNESDIKKLKRSAQRVRELSDYYNSMMERYDWGDEQTSLLVKKLFALKSGSVDAEDRISDIKEKINKAKGSDVELDISNEKNLADLYTSLYHKNEIIKDISNKVKEKYDEFEEAVKTKDFSKARSLEKQIRDLTGNWVDPIDPAFVNNHEQGLLQKMFVDNAEKSFNDAVDEFITLNNPELIDAKRNEKNNWALAEISDRLANNDLLDSYYNELAHLEIQKDKFDKAIREVNSTKGRKEFVNRTLAQFEELFKDYEDTSEFIHSQDPLSKVKAMTAQINNTIKDLEKVLDIAAVEYTKKKKELVNKRDDIINALDEAEVTLENTKLRLESLESSKLEIEDNVDELKINIAALKKEKERIEEEIKNVPEEYEDDKRVIKHLMSVMFKKSDGYMYKLRSMPDALLQQVPDIESRRAGKSYVEILNDLKNEFENIESEKLQEIFNSFIKEHHNANNKDLDSSELFKDSGLQEELSNVSNSLDILENSVLVEMTNRLNKINDNIKLANSQISDLNNSIIYYTDQKESINKEYDATLEKLDKALNNKQRKFGKALQNAYDQKQQLEQAAQTIITAKQLENELEEAGVEEVAEAEEWKTDKEARKEIQQEIQKATDPSGSRTVELDVTIPKKENIEKDLEEELPKKTEETNREVKEANTSVIQPNIEQQIAKLFESNLEFAKSIYETLGFDVRQLKEDIDVTNAFLKARQHEEAKRINSGEFDEVKLDLNKELENIINNSNNPLFIELAKSIKNKKSLDTIKAFSTSKSFKTQEGFVPAAAYQAETQRLILFLGNTVRYKNKEDRYRYLLHELVHHFVDRELVLSNSQQAKNIRELFKYTKQALSKKNKSNLYGLQNEHEFITEALTNEEFQKELKKLNVPKEFLTKSFSIFDTFLELISKILGVNQSVLEAVVYQSADIFELQEYKKSLSITPEQKQQAVKLYSQYLDNTQLSIPISSKENIEAFKNFVEENNKSDLKIEKTFNYDSYKVILWSDGTGELLFDKGEDKGSVIEQSDDIEHLLKLAESLSDSNVKNFKEAVENPDVKKSYAKSFRVAKETKGPVNTKKPSSLIVKNISNIVKEKYPELSDEQVLTITNEIIEVTDSTYTGNTATDRVIKAIETITGVPITVISEKDINKYFSESKKTEIEKRRKEELKETPILTDSIKDIRNIYVGGKSYININASGLEVAENLRAGGITADDAFNARNEFSGKLYDWFNRGYEKLTGKTFEEKEKEINAKYDAELAESGAKNNILYSKTSIPSNEVQYQLKAVNILLSENALNWYERKGKSLLKQNKELYFSKLQQELQVPKDQLRLVKEIDNPTPERLALELLDNFNYTVEINVAKSNKPIQERIYTVDNNSYIGRDENGGMYFLREGNDVENEYFEYIGEQRAKEIMGEENYNRLAISKEDINTSYYSNLTVPGGTNYTENEIATPAITPSITSHAQFSTDIGIGWFRSDEATDKYYDTEQKAWVTKTKSSGSFDDIFGTSAKLIPTKTRRILEVQSDLFQKGRDKSDLTKDTNVPSDLFEELYIEAQTQGWTKEQFEKEKVKLIEEYGLKNKVKSENQFLQLLNKDNNWVTFFIKSIIQDSAKKGYEKVLFPSGNTASKVEGHSTLEEFKKQKEDRILKLEENKKTYDTRNPNATKEQRENRMDFYNREIDQLKQELERVEREGFSALRPIYNFYENVVTNILKKQGYNPVLITDEYGNTWNELDLSGLDTSVYLEKKKDTVFGFNKDGQAFVVKERFTNETVIHEAIHPFVSDLQSENKLVFDKLISDILSTPDGKKLKEQIDKDYSEFDESVRLQELLVQAVSAVANENIDEKTGKPLIDAVLRFIKWIVDNINRTIANKIINGERITSEDLDLQTTIQELADMFTLSLYGKIANNVVTKPSDLGVVTTKDIKPDYIVEYNNQPWKVNKINYENDVVNITNLTNNKNIEVPVAQIESVVADSSLDKKDLLDLIDLVENSMFPKEFFEKFILKRIENITSHKDIVKIADTINKFLKDKPLEFKLKIQNSFNNRIRFLADLYKDKIKNSSAKEDIYNKYVSGVGVLKSLFSKYEGMPATTFNEIIAGLSKTSLDALNNLGGVKYVQARWSLASKNNDNRVYEFISYEHRDDGLYYVVKDVANNKVTTMKSDYIYDPLDQINDRVDDKENLFSSNWLDSNGVSGDSAFELSTDSQGNKTLVSTKGKSFKELSETLNNKITDFVKESNEKNVPLDDILGKKVEIVITKQLATNKNNALRKVLNEIELLSARQVETYLNVGQLYANPSKLNKDKFIAISTWTDADILISVDTSKNDTSNFELLGYLRNPNSYRLIEKDANGVLQDKGVYHPGIILQEYELANTEGEKKAILSRFNELYMHEHGLELTEEDLRAYGSKMNFLDKLRQALITKFNERVVSPEEDVIGIPYSDLKDLMTITPSEGKIEFVDQSFSLDERYDDLSINGEMFIYDSSSSEYTIGSLVSNADLDSIKDLDPLLLDKPNFNSRYWLLFKDHNNNYRRASLKPKDASNKIREEVYQYFKDLSDKYKDTSVISAEKLDELNKEINDFLLSKIFIQLPKIGKNFSMLRFYLNPDRNGNLFNERGVFRLGVKVQERVQRTEGTVWLDSSSNAGTGKSRKYIDVSNQNSFYSTLEDILHNIGNQNNQAIEEKYDTNSELYEAIVKFKNEIKDYKIGPNIKVSVPKDLSKMTNQDIASLFFTTIGKSVTYGKRLHITEPFDKSLEQDITVTSEETSLVGNAYIRTVGDVEWKYIVTNYDNENVEFDTYRNGEFVSSNKMSHKAFDNFLQNLDMVEDVDNNKYGLRDMLEAIKSNQSSQLYDYLVNYTNENLFEGDDNIILLQAELNTLVAGDFTNEELEAKYQTIINFIDQIQDLKDKLC